MNCLNTIIPAMASSRGALITYSERSRKRTPFPELLSDVSRAAEALMRGGVGKGSRVGLVGANSYAWVVADLACLALGATTVAFDAENRQDWPWAIAHFCLDVLLADRPDVIGSPRALSLRTLAASSDAASRAPSPSWEADDVVTMKFTSGSTNAPKVIPARAASVDAVLPSVQDLFHHGPGDLVMVCVPLFVLQQRYWIYSAILYEFDVLVIPYAYTLAALVAERPTVVMGIPDLFETVRSQWAIRCNGSPAALREQFGGHIRYLWTGSAPLQSKTREAYDAAGLPLFEGYGSNETCIVSKNHPGANRPRTVGRPLPGKELRIAADGEILVRSAHPVATGYYGADAEVNRGVFRDGGFVATGDLGRIDADGYLSVVGRKKAVIVLSSGRKLHPELVQSRIERSPYVRHCILYGEGKPYPVALVVPDADDTTEDALRTELDRINQELERDQRVRRFAVARRSELDALGLFSPQMKLKRSDTIECFRKRLDGLY